MTMIVSLMAVLVSASATIDAHLAAPSQLLPHRLDAEFAGAWHSDYNPADCESTGGGRRLIGAGRASRWGELRGTMRNTRRGRLDRPLRLRQLWFSLGDEPRPVSPR
ncbi:hypothetical protein ACQP2X_39645 [Actinoplanes sp. CA-131856]